MPTTASSGPALPYRHFGALLRRCRRMAGLSQRALAERAGMSIRAIGYLERGSTRPYPDTLSRLIEALALTPAQRGTLTDAAFAPEGAAPEGAPALIAGGPISPSLPSVPPLVGREPELAVLRERLAACLAGRGGLVLLDGEAGVGKSALAEALCREAAGQRVRVLVGRCYDLSETPPYGPWTEVRTRFPSTDNLPPLPSAFDTDAPSSIQFFAEVRDFFVAAAARQPIVLLLDDLQWADPASLDLLRFLARALGTLRILILAIYRRGEIDRHHPLTQLLPLLVREAHAARLTVLPLSVAALRELVRSRYALAAGDEERLVAYLAQRTEGNALFATELLHTLEEGGVLVPSGAIVGDLTGIAVPALLRQMIEGRVVRLGSAAADLLCIAAVIGQEVPLALWAAVAAADERTVEEMAERALAAGLLAEARGGAEVTLAHALVREALYESIPALRRRRIHRATGEALAGEGDAAPDTVAYHFQQAGDARAAEWLLRAGWQAYRSLAYETARSRFEEALPQLAAGERARVLFVLAAICRHQARGIQLAEDAIAAARVAGDEVLAAQAQFRLGLTLCYHQRIGAGLAATGAAMQLLDAVPDDALPDFYGLTGLTYAHAPRTEFRAYALASGGWWRDVLALFGGTPETMLARLDTQRMNGMLGILYVSILLGRLTDAQRAATASMESPTRMGDDQGMLNILLIEDCTLLLPFLLDDPDARQRRDAESARVTRHVKERLGSVRPHLHQCPLLIVAGGWAEARTLWAQRASNTFSTDRAWNLPYVGAMARAQGETNEAWALVHEGVPDGPQAEPGTTHFHAVDLYCLAARLALDTGEHARAHTWLEAHARWLAWVGPEVRWGRANGHIAWGEYHRAIGGSEAALRHAEQALAAASAPRQPLALLGAHRLLGELLREGGRYGEARAHLDLALSLADACGAPYERALTLLARATLDRATGDTVAAHRALTEVRAVCEGLGAAPAVAHATALMATLTRN